jgi:hypothetical protein
MAKEKGQKDKQHNSQKKMAEAQATPWPKEMDRRTSNTMAFWPLCYLFFCPFLLAIMLLVLLSFSFCHCVACPSVLFLLAMVLLVLLSFSFGHCVTCPVLFFWSLCTMTKKKGQKYKQHNGQKNRDRKTSNTMVKRKGQKDKQHNGQKKKTEGQSTQPFSVGHGVACPSVIFF